MYSTHPELEPIHVHGLIKSSQPSMTTSTMAYSTNLPQICNCYKKISEMYLSPMHSELDPSSDTNPNKILCVKSVAIPQEYYTCNEEIKMYSGINSIIRRQERIKREVESGITAQKPQRGSKGKNNLYFQASVEFVIKRDESYADRTVKPYKIRVYPTTGTAQITGVQLPLITGENELMYVLLRIKDFIGSDVTPVIHAYNINMMNFKYIIYGKETEELKLKVLASHFTNIMNNNVYPQPPYPITFTTSPAETTSFIFIRFHTPCKSKKERHTSFKIFTKKKVNVFASPNFEYVVELSKYIDTVLLQYWSDIVYDTATRRIIDVTSFTDKEIETINKL